MPPTAIRMENDEDVTILGSSNQHNTSNNTLTSSSSSSSSLSAHASFVSLTTSSKYVKASTDVRFMLFDPTINTFHRIQFGMKALSAMTTLDAYMEVKEAREKEKVRRRLMMMKQRREEAERKEEPSETPPPSPSSSAAPFHRHLPPRCTVAFSTVGMPPRIRELHNASISEQKRQFASLTTSTAARLKKEEEKGEEENQEEQNEQRNEVEKDEGDDDENEDNRRIFCPTVGLNYSHYAELRIITDVHHPARGQYGLFAKRTIPQGTVLTPYAGTIQYCNLNPSSRCYVMGHAHTVTMEIDGEYVGNIARFANDPRGVPVYPSTLSFVEGRANNHNNNNSSHSNVSVGSPQSNLALLLGANAAIANTFLLDSSSSTSLSPYPPETPIYNQKFPPNVEAQVLTSRFGEVFTALVSNRSIPGGHEILLDYGKTHRLRSQRLMSFGGGGKLKEVPLTRPRETSCFPAPLLPPLTTATPTTMMAHNSANTPMMMTRIIARNAKRERGDGDDHGDSHDADDGKDEIIEAGMRLFWQCAHCGHHTHTSTYPTYVTLCRNCEAPRAANVSLAVAYTPAALASTAASSSSSALPSTAANRNSKKNNSPNLTNSSPPSGQPPFYTGGGSKGEEGGDNNHSTAAQSAISREISLNDAAALLSPKKKGQPEEEGENVKKVVLPSCGSSEADTTDIIEKIQIQKHFDPVSFNPNHWGRDQLHRRGGTIGFSSTSSPTGGPVVKSSSSPSTSGASASFSFSSPSSPASPSFTVSSSSSASLFPNAFVSQSLLVSDAHRLGIRSIPAPFPLNFPFIPWPVYDSRIPICDVRIEGMITGTDKGKGGGKGKGGSGGGGGGGGLGGGGGGVGGGVSGGGGHHHHGSGGGGSSASVGSVLLGTSDVQIQEVTTTITRRLRIEVPTSSSSSSTESLFNVAIGDHIKIRLERIPSSLPSTTIATSSSSASFGDNQSSASVVAAPTIAMFKETTVVTRMGVETIVRSDKIVWRRGEEVGAVGGIVLFANDPRISKRRMAHSSASSVYHNGGSGSDDNDNGGSKKEDPLLQIYKKQLVFQQQQAALDSTAAAAATKTEPHNVGGGKNTNNGSKITNHHNNQHQAIKLSASVFSKMEDEQRRQRRLLRLKSKSSRAKRVEIVASDSDDDNDDETETDDDDNDDRSQSDDGGFMFSPLKNPNLSNSYLSSTQRVSFCIPIKHTFKINTSSSGGDGPSMPSSSMSTTDSMVLLPTNEFAHIGIIPSSSTSSSASNSANSLPPFTPHFMRSNAFVPQQHQHASSSSSSSSTSTILNPQPNVTFVTSMDGNGCVFMAVVALCDIAQTIELYVSEDDVIMLR